MELEISEDSCGPVEIIMDSKRTIPIFKVPGTELIMLKGTKIISLLQEFKGTFCSGWFNHYKASKPTTLRARGARPTLELRISLSHPIAGTWDDIEEPELYAHFYNIYYTTHVNTVAKFEPASFESFDVHFLLELLPSLGINHRLLDKFISKVTAERPATLFTHQMPCSPALIELLFTLRHLQYARKVQLQLFDLKLKEILLLALEPLLRLDIKPEYYVPPKEREMLYAAKDLIAEDITSFPGTDVICKRTGLNEYKLRQGFNAVFGQTAYDYHLALKINRSKKLLLESDDKIRLIAYELGYEHHSSFGREFLKHTGLSPKAFRAKKGSS